MRRFICVLALVVAPAAAGSGPWLGTLDGGDGVSLANAPVSYVATQYGDTTTVAVTRKRDGRVLRSISLRGGWGIPYVTLNSGVGGLSSSGRLLVLADRFQATGALRSQSSFVVLGTAPLRVQATIRLRGDFGFDALSPNGRTLYLIQHVSTNALASYRVRAYDLASSRLLARAIADKRQAGWTMSGWPVARATSGDGRWVYTLYQQDGNYPFVHALDAAGRTAVCIGLPWAWTRLAADEIMSARLSVAGGKLVIAGSHGTGTRFALDTRTFRVTLL